MFQNGRRFPEYCANTQYVHSCLCGEDSKNGESITKLASGMYTKRCQNNFVFAKLSVLELNQILEDTASKYAGKSGDSFGVMFTPFNINYTLPAEIYRYIYSYFEFTRVFYTYYLHDSNIDCIHSSKIAHQWYAKVNTT